MPDYTDNDILLLQAKVQTAIYEDSKAYGIIGRQNSSGVWQIPSGEAGKRLITVTLENDTEIKADAIHVSPTAGAQVWLFKEAGQWVIQGNDPRKLSANDFNAGESTPKHNHNIGNILYYPIDLASLADGLVLPTGNGLEVTIGRVTYPKLDGTLGIYESEDVLDLANAVTGLAANQSRWVVIYILRSDGTVVAFNATAVNGTLNYTTHIEDAVAECLASEPDAYCYTVAKIRAGMSTFGTYKAMQGRSPVGKDIVRLGVMGAMGIGSSSSLPSFPAATKAIASGIVAVGTDRLITVAAETGTTDDLIEITGLSIGDKVLLIADIGDTITVKHNDAGATIKVLIQSDADFVLDEVHPLELVLKSATELVQVYDENTGGGGGAPTDAKYVTTASDATLSAEVVISGLAGQLGVHGTGSGGISEEYNSSSTGLTWNSAPTIENSNQAYGTGKPSSLFVSVTGTTVYVGTRAFAPAGAYEAICQLEMWSNDGTASGSGVFFYIGNAGDTNRTIIGISRSATNNYGVFAFTYTGGVFTQRGTTVPLGGTMHGFFKMTRDGSNNVSFYWSSNGYNWLLIATQAFTFTPAAIGYLLSTGASLTYGLYSDFLRTNV